MMAIMRASRWNRLWSNGCRRSLVHLFNNEAGALGSGYRCLLDLVGNRHSFCSGNFYRRSIYTGITVTCIKSPFASHVSLARVKASRVQTRAAIAWRGELARKGTPGVDGQDFEDIEAYGVERWLGELAPAARQNYRPDPIRRVYIPKANGKLRGWARTLRDRVCMTAAMLVLEPIFRSDRNLAQLAHLEVGSDFCRRRSSDRQFGRQIRRCKVGRFCLERRPDEGTRPQVMYANGTTPSAREQLPIAAVNGECPKGNICHSSPITATSCLRERRRQRPVPLRRHSVDAPSRSIAWAMCRFMLSRASLASLSRIAS